MARNGWLMRKWLLRPHPMTVWPESRTILHRRSRHVLASPSRDDSKLRPLSLPIETALCGGPQKRANLFTSIFYLLYELFLLLVYMLCVCSNKSTAPCFTCIIYFLGGRLFFAQTMRLHQIHYKYCIIIIIIIIIQYVRSQLLVVVVAWNMF